MKRDDQRRDKQKHQNMKENRDASKIGTEDRRTVHKQRSNNLSDVGLFLLWKIEFWTWQGEATGRGQKRKKKNRIKKEVGEKRKMEKKKWKNNDKHNGQISGTGPT